MITVKVWYEKEEADETPLPVVKKYKATADDDISSLVEKDFPGTTDLTWQIV